MRIIFMGSPNFAVHFLSELLYQQYNIVAIFSAPLTIRGKRGRQPEHCDVAKFAIEHDLQLFTPDSLKDSLVQQQIKDLKPDLIIVVAYGALLPKAVLNIPKYGCINVHGSILPRWRGAAPIERAIEAGDLTTGIAIMKMEAGLDTGPVALTKTVTIDSLNSLELRELLAKIGAPLLIEALKKLELGTLTFIPQQGKATYAHKITKEETRINWNAAATIIERKIRCLAPIPGAWCEMKLLPQKGNDQSWQTHRVKIIAAQFGSTPDYLSKKCNDGNYINIKLCQKSGGKILNAKQFVAGYSKVEIF